MKRIRYFILRSINIQNVDKSVDRGVWATQPHNEEKLNDALGTCDEVLLIFSVNGSGHFQGYARMASPVRAEQAAIWEGDAKVGGAFLVDWRQRVDLQYSDTEHLRNPWNENKPVRICRDGTEVEPTVGAELVALIDRQAERSGARRPPPGRLPPGAAGKAMAPAGGGGFPGMGMAGGPRGGGEARHRELPPGARAGMGPGPDFHGPRGPYGGMMGGMMGGMPPEMAMMGMMPPPMMGMGMMGGFGMPFGGMMGGMPGYKGDMMGEGGFGGGMLGERPGAPDGFGRAPGGFEGMMRGGGGPEGPPGGPRGYGGVGGGPGMDPRFGGMGPRPGGGGSGAGFDGGGYRGEGGYGMGPDWGRGRPPSPGLRYRDRSPDWYGPPQGGRLGYGDDYGERGPPPGDYAPARARGEERPDILDMQYDDYVARFERVQDLRRGAGGGGPEARGLLEGGPSSGDRGGTGGVHLMSEEQYLAYCERYMAKMGMPFDPGMVRQHYRRMREAAGV